MSEDDPFPTDQWVPLTRYLIDVLTEPDTRTDDVQVDLATPAARGAATLVGDVTGQSNCC